MLMAPKIRSPWLLLHRPRWQTAAPPLAIPTSCLDNACSSNELLYPFNRQRPRHSDYHVGLYLRCLLLSRPRSVSEKPEWKTSSPVLLLHTLSVPTPTGSTDIVP
jgi:hypothetical protein